MSPTPDTATEQRAAEPMPAIDPLAPHVTEGVAERTRKRIKKLRGELKQLEEALRPEVPPSGDRPSPARHRPPLALTVFLAVALAAGLVVDVVSDATVMTEHAQVAGSIVTAGAPIGGRIAALLVEEGQAVQAGQAVVQLEEADLQAQLARSEANLAIARAALRPSETGVELSGVTTASAVAQAASAVEVARADLAAARTQVARFKGELKRLEPLQVSGYVSALTVDASRMDVRIAEANVVASRARLQAAEEALRLAKAGGADLAVKRGGVETALAQVQGAEADVRAAKLRLSQTRITAPASGVVARRLAHDGQVVSAGQGLLAIVDQDRLWINAYIDETQAPRVKTGQPVEVRLDAFPTRAIAGRVAVVNAATGDALSLAPSNTLPGTGTRIAQRVPVKITLERTDLALKPGMSALVRISVK